MSATRLTLLLLLVLPILFAGCGGDDSDLPDGAVATVAGTEISTNDLDRMVGAITVNRGGQAGVACVIKRKRTETSAACQKQFDQHRREAVRMLIRSRWYSQIARERGVKVDPASVAFGDYAKVLKKMGLAPGDMVPLVRYAGLQQSLMKPKYAEISKEKVSEQEMRAYYEKVKANFRQPEQRFVRLILTQTEQQADRAQTAIERGDSWKQIARKHGQKGVRLNGLLVDVALVGDDALERAAQSAKKNGVDTVHGSAGWYAFRLERIDPPAQEPLKNMREYVMGRVRIEKQERALAALHHTLREKYGSETRCASDYRVADCAT